MKLLFDSTELSYFYEDSGHKAGVYYVSLNILKELQKRGIQLTFICNFKRYYFMKEVLETQFKGIELLEEHSLINKFWAKLLYKTKNLPIKIKYGLLILARFYEAWFCRVNKKNAAQLEKFDTYFSPFTQASVEVSKSDLKRFRMIHDVIPVIEQGYPKSPKDWYYGIYNDINENDYYVTNSEYTRQDVLKYFPQVKSDNILTVGLGANENFCKYNGESPVEGNYIFSLCTLGKRKNIEFGIRAFFKFIKKNNINDLKLVLGGSIWNKYEKTLKTILDEYDRSKVVLTGYINEEELSKYYSNALCFIYPSLYEGFGLPVLESMQCGCPVIASNKSSLPEVLGECGILINPQDESEMVNAYEKMYYDTDFRTKCSTSGLDRARIFSWKKCVDNLLEFMI